MCMEQRLLAPKSFADRPRDATTTAPSPDVQAPTRFKIPALPSKNLLRDSRLKTQDPRLKTQSTHRFKTQGSRLKTQDSRLKTKTYYAFSSLSSLQWRWKHRRCQHHWSVRWWQPHHLQLHKILLQLQQQGLIQLTAFSAVLKGELQMLWPAGTATSKSNLRVETCWREWLCHSIQFLMTLTPSVQSPKFLINLMIKLNLQSTINIIIKYSQSWKKAHHRLLIIKHCTLTLLPAQSSKHRRCHYSRVFSNLQMILID